MSKESGIQKHIEAIRDAFKKYARHQIGYSCGWSAINGDVCHCGLKEALKKIESYVKKLEVKE
jgi:hypothetical protein